MSEDSRLSTASSAAPNSTAQIQVYARIRPSPKLSNTTITYDTTSNVISFNIPKDLAADYINNKKSLYSFNFHGVFPPLANQEELFGAVGQPALDALLTGYNSTIFAYGQTGSGKTFTITGGVEKYEDRGIIPRTLARLFECLQSDNANQQGTSTTIRISYLEIYNEHGYDLLDPSHANISSTSAMDLSRLPPVTLRTDENGDFHLVNLSELPVANLDEALNLLFIGDTNRIVCETPSNENSTRSHCIFTITLEQRNALKNSIVRSKLHLVDLAGSERIKKTAVNGKLMKEANFINLSLHYLEQVIVALNERSRTKDENYFIPYRNSMMTSVLRDSLGGNCQTFMIATVSGEKNHVEESISTSRFAQRVASIRNTISINEELDSKVVITKLKQENHSLREEVSVLRGEKRLREEDVTEAEMERYRSQITEFIKCKLENLPELPNQFEWPSFSSKRVRACMEVWRDLYVELNGKKGVINPSDGVRPNELSSSSNNIAYEQKKSTIPMTIASSNNTSLPQRQSENKRFDPKQIASAAPSPSPSLPLSQNPVRTNSTNPTGDLSKATAFDTFRRSYRQYAVIEEQKEEYKQKIEEAKQRGERINSCREKINKMKVRYEQMKIRHGMQDLMKEEKRDNNENESENSVVVTQKLEEETILKEIEQEKMIYREEFEKLKKLKEEIEGRKNLMERSRKRMQKDFEIWWESQHPQEQPQQSCSPIIETKDDRSTSNSSFTHEHPSRASMQQMNHLHSNSNTRLNTPPSSHNQASPSPSPQPLLSSAAASSILSTSTGNAIADAEIAKFLALREQMKAQRQL